MSKTLRCEDQIRKLRNVSDVILKVSRILQSFQTSPGTIIYNRTQPTFLVLPTFDCHPSVQLQYFLSLIVHPCPLHSYRMSTRHVVGHIVCVWGGGGGGCRDL
jgi:hypothetical protein